jgi:hypothetical protein
VTYTTNHKSDVSNESELHPQLLEDLRLAYQPALRLVASDAAMRQLVRQPANRRRAGWMHLTSHRLRLRLVTPIMAAAVLLLSLGAYLHVQGPTPVSAQTILKQAETAGLAPDQITKFVYQVTNSANFGGSVQIWVEANADGQPARLGYEPQPQVDDATHQEVCPTAAQCYGNIATRFLVGSYEDIVGQNSPASLAGSQVTGQQTYDGVLCAVVQAPSGATLYFDAQTYVLRGAEWTDLQQGGAQHGPNSTWHAQLSSSGIVAASDAPALPWMIETNGFSSTTGSDAKSVSVTVTRSP